MFMPREISSTRLLGKRLTIVLVAGLLLISAFFIVGGYLTMKKRLQKDVLSRLHSIAKTVSLHIKGDEHDKVIAQYDTVSRLPKDDQSFMAIHELLRETKNINGLNTEIYTLYFEEVHEAGGDEELMLGISSGKVQYFGHRYESAPPELIKNFSKGGVLAPYKDDHGTWLSAFMPIVCSNGKTAAIVQVDQRFDDFISIARNEAFINLIVSVVIVSSILLLMLYLVRKMIKVDIIKSEKLKSAYELVGVQNKKIKDSINYAQRIQNSIIPSEKDLQELFPESFMYYKAKDIVSGDFPWYFRHENEVYIAAIDCTGHGVPGAMMSFIGYFLLNQITSTSKKLSPGEILDELHEGVVRTLKQDENSSSANDGMDVALCKINLDTNQVWYSGAHRPLYVIGKSGLKEYKGSRKAIGGTHYDKFNRSFETVSIEIEKGDEFYFFSDGLPDQIGGERTKKYGPKRLRSLFENNRESTMEQIKKELEKEFVTWMRDLKQLDDVLLIGVRL